LKYGVRPRTFLQAAKIAGALLFADRERARLLLRRAKLEISADIFLELCMRYRPTFASFVTFYVDFVSHRYWRYRDPEQFQYVDRRTLELYGSAVDESYFALDDVVGRLLASVGEDCVVGIVSEHGMDPEPVSTELGPWYFTIRAGRIQELLGLDTGIKPHPVARWVAFRPVSAEDSPFFAAQLRQIEVVETARPLFRVYEHRDEVIIKFALDEATPIEAIDQIEKLSVKIGGKIVPFTEIGRKTGRQRSAMHARDGVFVLAGPHIKHGNRLAEASILDFAPTLLKAVGMECDQAFDGKVLDIFQ
jgi:predicted AlkP superfamily phosphohydrolase/phosphomutase